MIEGDGVVLVTGGAGYIGSHTCKALAKAGYTPVAGTRPIPGNPERHWSISWRDYTTAVNAFLSPAERASSVPTSSIVSWSRVTR